MDGLEPEGAEAVRVVESDGEAALVATCRIAAGQLILVADGIRLDHPTRTSVQQAPGEHHDVPPGIDGASRTCDYSWYALNHSCEPNAYWNSTHLLARRMIRSGEAITFDYETTEDELSTPFRCACGSPACAGRMVRGYRCLSHEERLRRLPYLRPDLQEALRLGE